MFSLGGFICSCCNRSFNSERKLRLHVRFCDQKSQFELKPALVTMSGHLDPQKVEEALLRAYQTGLLAKEDVVTEVKTDPLSTRKNKSKVCVEQPKGCLDSDGTLVEGSKMTKGLNSAQVLDLQEGLMMTDGMAGDKGFSSAQVLDVVTEVKTDPSSTRKNKSKVCVEQPKGCLDSDGTLVEGSKMTKGLNSAHVLDLQEGLMMTDGMASDMGFSSAQVLDVVTEVKTDPSSTRKNKSKVCVEQPKGCLDSDGTLVEGSKMTKGLNSAQVLDLQEGLKMTKGFNSAQLLNLHQDYEINRLMTVLEMYGINVEGLNMDVNDWSAVVSDIEQHRRSQDLDYEATASEDRLEFLKIEAAFQDLLAEIMRINAMQMADSEETFSNI